MLARALPIHLLGWAEQACAPPIQLLGWAEHTCGLPISTQEQQQQGMGRECGGNAEGM